MTKSAPYGRKDLTNLEYVIQHHPDSGIPDYVIPITIVDKFKESYCYTQLIEHPRDIPDDESRITYELKIKKGEKNFYKGLEFCKSRFCNVCSTELRRH